MRTILPSLFVLAAAMLTAGAAQAVQVDFFIRAQHDSVADIYWGEILSFLLPNDPDLPYSTGLIASADREFSATDTGGGWSLQMPNFYSSLGALISALQQPWEIILDEGLPTERNYSMALDLGTTPTSGLSPPSVSFPIFDQTINTLMPTFAFTLGTPDFYFADLYRFQGSTGVFHARDGLPSGSTSWTPGGTLIPGTEYFLDIYNTSSMPGLGFATPQDGGGDPIANWQSNGSVHAETIIRFTAVPEPASVALMALGLSAPLYFGRRRRRG